MCTYSFVRKEWVILVLLKNRCCLKKWLCFIDRLPQLTYSRRIKSTFCFSHETTSIKVVFSIERHKKLGKFLKSVGEGVDLPWAWVCSLHSSKGLDNLMKKWVLRIWLINIFFTCIFSSMVAKFFSRPNQGSQRLWHVKDLLTAYKGMLCHAKKI